MTITLAQNAARVSYSVSEGATQTSFTVSFEFFDDADLNVYVDGTLKTISTHYTVSGGSGSTGAVAISVTGASGGSTVVITRSIALARTTDFPSSGSFQIGTLNTELDRFTAIAADLKDSVDRGLILSDSDSSVSTTLPLLASRKGTVLGFNASTGAVEAGPSITAVQTLSAASASINLLGTAAVVEDMGLLSASAVIEDMGLLATAAIIEDMGLLATSAVIEDMGLLATSVVIEDMGLLGTSANVTSMGLLGNSTVITNISNLSASAVIVDMAILGTTDAVADMAILGTSDVVSDMNTLATSANVTAMGRLGTSAVVTDMGLLGTAAVVEDMGILGTSANVTAMSNVSGSISNVNTVATNLSGITAFSAVYSSGGTDPSSNLNEGDLFFNTNSDSLKVYDGSAWVAGVTAGSGFLPLAGGQLTGNVTMAGSQTVDGRDVSADGTKLDGIEASATADQTNAEIRTAVEAASDSNVFTDADHTKLNGVAASSNNYVHPNHSGEVTSSADGATVVADNVVDEANLKVSNSAVNGYMLTAQSGNTGGLTWAAAGGGGTEFIASSGNVSNADTIDFTGFDSDKYDSYYFFFHGVVPVNNNTAMKTHLAVSGTSYNTTNGHYHYGGATDSTGFYVTVGVGNGGAGIGGHLLVSNAHKTEFTYGISSAVYMTSPINLSNNNSSSNRNSAFLNTGSVTAARFKFDSGNIESGEITMFGVVNS